VQLQVGHLRPQTALLQVCQQQQQLVEQQLALLTVLVLLLGPSLPRLE
jgi:hypothetical protein